MSKKELRKELELLLVKTITEVLSKKDAARSKKIGKNIAEASKTIAKKFYKAAKPEAQKIAVSKDNKPVVKNKPAAKRAVKKAATKRKK